jgi:hypothetical protein
MGRRDIEEVYEEETTQDGWPIGTRRCANLPGLDEQDTAYYDEDDPRVMLAREERSYRPHHNGRFCTLPVKESE